MSKRRTDFIRKPKLPFWKPDGNLWYAERADLEAAVIESKRTEVDIKSRMGVGYCHLEDALNGKRLDRFSASHMEWGIAPNEV